MRLLFGRCELVLNGRRTPDWAISHTSMIRHVHKNLTFAFRSLSTMSLPYAYEKQVALAAVRRACALTSSVFNKLIKNETLTKGDKSPVTGEQRRSSTGRLIPPLSQSATTPPKPSSTPSSATPSPPIPSSAKKTQQNCDSTRAKPSRSKTGSSPSPTRRSRPISELGRPLIGDSVRGRNAPPSNSWTPSTVGEIRVVVSDVRCRSLAVWMCG